MNKKDIKNILIVCTGNSCRSVMAEGYLRKRLAELGLDIKVRSAGTATFYGLTPPGSTVDAMREIGVDVSGHTARPITPDMVKEADIILVMEPEHKTAVLSIDPDSKSKILYLRSFDDEAHETVIPDPIGRGIVFYRSVLDVIKRSMEGFLQWLKNLQ